MIFYHFLVPKPVISHMYILFVLGPHQNAFYSHVLSWSLFAISFKLRAQIPVLKKAVLDEQNKEKNLQVKTYLRPLSVDIGPCPSENMNHGLNHQDKVQEVETEIKDREPMS